MSDKSRQKIEAIARQRALTPAQQRRVWARVTTCRHFLVKAGLCTVDEFNGMESQVLQEAEQKILDHLKRTTGADTHAEDPDHHRPR